MFFILLFVSLIYAGGLGLQGYAMSRERNSINISAAGGQWFYSKVVCPIKILWVVPLLILFFGVNFIQTYYDYFLSELILRFIFGLWSMTAVIFLWLQFVWKPALTDKLVLAFITFMFGGLFCLYIFSSSQMLSAITQEPQFTTGLLTKKYSNGGGRDPHLQHFHLTVDEINYETPDRIWYKQLVVGEEFDYAYNPVANEIFSPKKIGLTWHGVMNFMNGILLWSIMTFLMVDGWMNLGNVIRDIQYSRKSSVGKQ